MTDLKQNNQLLTNPLLCFNCKGENFKVYYNFINNYSVQTSGITLKCNKCNELRVMDVI